MKNLNKIAMASMLMLSAMSAKADYLFIAGEGVLTNWDLDKATALLSATNNDKVFSGTVYLNADKDFKFLTTSDWGGLEYGAEPDATMTDGEITLASGSNDEGYGKLQVAEAGNYLITVDTENMTASFVKSAYQATEIEYCSLFMVGDATPGGWDVVSGLPMYQNAEKPYEFKAENVTLDAGDFKIADALKGASTWNAAYWYVRDAEDAGKMVLDSSEDNKWQIADAGIYTVTANTLDNTISIEKNTSTVVSSIAVVENQPTEYYTLDGVRVDSPSNGIYICRKGSAVFKVILK